MAKLALLGGEPVRTKPFPRYPKIGEEEVEAVLEVLKIGTLSSLRGSKTREFEEEFAKYMGVDYAIAVSSGTAALHLALAAVGVGPGDEVIVPAYTFTSTATAVLMQCAVPVFADVKEDTFTIDPEDVERKITEHTRAIIVVHLFGCPAEMDEIMRIAREHDLYVIEDCAQAHGAEYKGKKVGGIGDVGCFSFYESKNMMTGEGGMVTTNDPDIAERVRMLRNHAEIRGLEEYLQKKPLSEVTNMLGWNYRMTEVQAALGIVQLKKLDKANERRRQVARKISEVLKKTGLAEPPVEPSYVKHVYHVYCSKYYEEEYGVPRDVLINALRAEGIPVSPGYTKPLYDNPLYMYKLSRKHGCPFTCPYYKGSVKYEKGMCPVTEELCYKRALWFPCHSEISDEDLNDIVVAIEKIAENIEELKGVKLSEEC